MTPLERRYRGFLLAYPRDYRAAHGGELLGLLLDTAPPGRTVPDPREVAGLVSGGVRARLAAATRRGPAWADGLHLGATALTAVQFAALLPYAPAIPLWTALSALALLAVMRGRPFLALPLVLLTGAKSVAIAAGTPLFDTTLLPVFPAVLADSPLFARTGPVAVAAGYALAGAALLVLAARGRRAAPRSWWWAAAVPLAAWTPAAAPHPLDAGRIALELCLLALAVWASRLTRDPRWSLGAILYLLAASATLTPHLQTPASRHLAYWTLLTALTATAALAACDAPRAATALLRRLTTPA
ncbi:hypothetical protein [Bailinhaonella thermotolerans]|uniref:Uncharacterized protein n=1 Tax=Bailinhaonella thermotolerans TaxID=1070861 RepID=A0A3A4AWW6_9ACTN|nr:hypothetical protein [Bailinhaonella thermotolerans]RJL30417.1 hypothetical protein D5H75_22870 [Bailinhaonella thermotolerans]